MKKIKAWAVIEDGKLIPYQFSQSGENTLMVFPTKTDAKIFQGTTKSWEVRPVTITYSPAPKKEKKSKK
jgi:hypothetical protein